MVELTEYERRGDVDRPFELTKKQDRAQREAVQRRESRCEVQCLTWEAYVAGEPCPGCGLPYRDEERWESKGTMYFTESERLRYEAEQARFAAAHPDCHAVRHSVSGSLTTHCGKCCPAPPLSPRQREEIASIFARPRPAYEQMRWRLRLYCGHVVERHAHFQSMTIHAAFMTDTTCDQCGLDPAIIVDAEAIGLVEEPPTTKSLGAVLSPKPRGPRKPTRAELEARVRELEGELEQLRDRGVAGGGETGPS